MGASRRLAVIAALLLSSPAALAVTLVQTSDPGYYNNSIGTVLNLSNTGSDTCAEPFPISNDCTITYPTAPNLSAASSALGNWLGDPLSLNSNWNYLSSIPNNWAIGTEVAVIYKFDTLGATNVEARFGVDNGIFVWLDGSYLYGARAGGGVVQWEYNVPVGDLASGTHFLQLLLEDHGVTNGYAVNITADSYTPGPSCGLPGGPPCGVPEPATLALLGVGLAGLGFSRRGKGGRATR